MSAARFPVPTLSGRERARHAARNDFITLRRFQNFIWLLVLSVPKMEIRESSYVPECLFARITSEIETLSNVEIGRLLNYSILFCASNECVNEISRLTHIAWVISYVFYQRYFSTSGVLVCKTGKSNAFMYFVSINTIIYIYIEICDNYHVIIISSAIFCWLGATRANIAGGNLKNTSRKPGE